ncbi:hypothetical protein O9992_27010 [Vibrio lentus]|nr:hypothetical protein [Vibrio lentus]
MQYGDDARGSRMTGGTACRACLRLRPGCRWWTARENMNGVEATQFIRQQLGLETLIFAYTADVFREAHDSFIEAGADHVLTKPLQQREFLRCAATVCSTLA